MAFNWAKRALPSFLQLTCALDGDDDLAPRKLRAKPDWFNS